MSLRNPTLRVQLLIAFGALLALVLAVAVVLLGHFGGIDDARSHMEDKAAPYASSLSAATLEMKATANDERGFLMTGDTEFRDEIAERTEKIHGSLAAAAKLAPDAEAADRIEAITAKFDAWTQAIDAEFELHATDPTGATDVALGANRDLRKAYEAELSDAVAGGDADLAESLHDVAGDTAAARTALIAG